MSVARPECKFRIGRVTASVWRQEAEGNRLFRTVSVQRSYKDGDETKYTDSFSLGDLANVQRVLAKAQDYIEAKEAKLNTE